MESDFRDIKGHFDDEYIEKIKKIKLTKEQEKAYKKLVKYHLEKERTLYSNYLKELEEDYFWVMVGIIKEDKIIDYVKNHYENKEENYEC